MNPYTSAILGGGDGSNGAAGAGGGSESIGLALLGPCVFRNAAAALQLDAETSDNFLDRTLVHPEYYMCGDPVPPLASCSLAFPFPCV